MKKLFKSLLLVSIITTFFNHTAMAATQTIKASVNGMVCAFCAQGIEKKMRKLSQTQDVYVNLKKRVVAVELKEGEVMSNDTVTEVIQDAGYDVVSIEIIEQPVAAIKAEMKAK